MKLILKSFKLANSLELGSLGEIEANVNLMIQLKERLRLDTTFIVTKIMLKLYKNIPKLASYMGLRSDSLQGI